MTTRLRKHVTPGVSVVLHSLVATSGLHMLGDGTYRPALVATRARKAARKRERQARREGRR